jgi:uncharacterized protein
MPTNVTPEYKKAEEAYRKAREPKERLDCLKQMLSTIPKHKGTEHLQADIKSRIKDLTEELAGPKKGGKRSGPALTIRPEGAAQIALLGPPNSGKSALHLRLTGSRAQSGPGPFITQFPEPGMLGHEDIAFQLLDLPSMSSDHSPPWIASALQTSDAALLVVDLSDPGCVEQVQFILDTLAARKISLVAAWPGLGRDGAAGNLDQEPAAEADDPFRIELPTLLLANKADLAPDPGEVAVLEELLGVDFPALRVSAETGQGLGRARALAVRGAGHRAGLHQGARQGAGARQALHRAARPDRARCRPAGAQGHRGELPLRPALGQRRIRRPAGRRRSPGRGWRRGRAARLACRNLMARVAGTGREAGPRAPAA